MCPEGVIWLYSLIAKSPIFGSRFSNLCQFVPLPFVMGESRSLKKKSRDKLTTCKSLYSNAIEIRRRYLWDRRSRVKLSIPNGEIIKKVFLYIEICFNVFILIKRCLLLMMSMQYNWVIIYLLINILTKYYYSLIKWSNGLQTARCFAKNLILILLILICKYSMRFIE